MKRWTFQMESVRKCDGLNCKIIYIYILFPYIVHRLAELASSDLSIRCLALGLSNHFTWRQEFWQGIIFSRNVPLRNHGGTAAASRYTGRRWKGHYLFPDAAMARTVESEGRRNAFC